MLFNTFCAFLLFFEDFLGMCVFVFVLKRKVTLKGRRHKSKDTKTEFERIIHKTGVFGEKKSIFYLLFLII